MTREEAKHWIEIELKTWEDECKSKHPIKEALSVAIEALEQEPRKGHWDIKDNMWWVCSACGCQTRMMKKYNVPNFCPACGADMRGEK